MKMEHTFKISAGGVLLLSALYFFLTFDEFAALILASAAHEAGHIAAILATGGHVRSLTANISGAVIAQTPAPNRAADVLRSLSGPLAGMAYALAASCASETYGSDMLALSAGMSAVLSAFNALPVLPLDGGKALDCLAGRRASAVCSLFTASAVMLVGIVLAASGMGFGVAIAGAALMAAQLKVQPL